MSLHHRKLSEVWTSLQGRHDIAEILREIIGQQSIDSALSDNGSSDSASSIEAVIWIKTIFDLQRCYLTGIANGTAECPPYVLTYLLPSELLLSSILYLVNLKTRLFPSQTTLITKEFTRPRQILAETILSGLRLLLLKKEHVAPHDKRRLQNSINSAWQNDRLHGVERFIVSDLFAQILDSLSTGPQRAPHENPYINEWQNARLPTFAAGLYPLDIRPETFVTPLIHGTMEEDWIDAYWVLFDCLWAVECAVVQRLVDIHRQTGVLGFNHQDADTDEALEHLYHTRTSLIISIFHITGPMTPLPALLESLALTLLDWNEDIDSFLSRQDSLMQQRSSSRPATARTPSYGRHLKELSPYHESALKSFAVWLCSRKPSHEQFTVRKPGILPDDVEELVKDWITRMTATSGETLSRELEGPTLPAYVVDCPKLHVVPKKHLEYKLRWCDKWAYESIQENSPIVNWKEGVHCPSCISGEKIKFARLIEPFQNLAAALENFHSDSQSLSQYSIGDSGSYDAASLSFNSAPSEADSAGISLPSRTTAPMSLPSHSSRPGGEDAIPAQLSGQPPGYSESPISPASPSMIHRAHSQGSSFLEGPVSPLSESLNVPIPLASRLSVDLPIPVRTPSISDSLPSNKPASAPSEMSSIRMDTPSSDSIRSGPSATKPKPSSRTVRIANSIRRKHTTKEKETYALPRDPAFVFSSSGHSLLLWGKWGSYIVRFDIPSNDTSAIQGCRYDISDIEAAAAGNHKCVVITASGREHMTHHLTVYDGMKLSSAYKVDLEFQGHTKNICLAVSRNDKYAAVSINDHIEIFRLEDDGIKIVPFHHQIHVYEMRGGTSHRRTIPIGRMTSQDSMSDPHRTETGWFGAQNKGLSSKEAAEEQMRQSAIISRELYFSPDSTRLAVATQLGDHCVYVDVWDCTREPVSTISEHSRSFNMPPWTLNDGDLTSVFYDSQRRCALVTAFLGKEYPMLIPFPGYDTLQNETYSTKVVHAAQSPSGASLVIANAMTEVIQFEYTVESTLSPRKLKRSVSKMPHGVFKPGAIALTMPLENVLQCFWIKDGRCMLRTIRLGDGEGYREMDLRSNFERLMGLKRNPVITRAPSLMIPEMEGN